MTTASVMEQIETAKDQHRKRATQAYGDGIRKLARGEDLGEHASVFGEAVAVLKAGAEDIDRHIGIVKRLKAIDDQLAHRNKEVPRLQAIIDAGQVEAKELETRLLKVRGEVFTAIIHRDTFTHLTSERNQRSGELPFTMERE